MIFPYYKFLKLSTFLKWLHEEQLSTWLSGNDYGFGSLITQVPKILLQIFTVTEPSLGWVFYANMNSLSIFTFWVFIYLACTVPSCTKTIRIFISYLENWSRMSPWWGKHYFHCWNLGNTWASEGFPEEHIEAIVRLAHLFNKYLSSKNSVGWWCSETLVKDRSSFVCLD
jgi:hypothetical protein